MARRRSNQAKWMKDPRNVNWTIAQITYESTGLPDKYEQGLHWYNDIVKTPRHKVEELIRQRKYENSEAGIRDRYLRRLRGLLEGE